jgi:hypothetical protein
MESLIAIVKKWKEIAETKQKEAIEIGDSHESNYQLGKIKICDDFIKQLNGEIKKKEISKERNTESLQSNGEDHRQQSNTV